MKIHCLILCAVPCSLPSATLAGSGSLDASPPDEAQPGDSQAITPPSPLAESQATEAPPAAASSAESTTPASTPPGPALADAAPAPALDFDLAQLENMLTTVVTTSRSERAVLEADRSVSATSQADRREMQATSVPEWLSELPGVFLQSTSPSAGTPIIRGFIGPQNLFLVDGVRLNTSTYRTGPLQYLNVTDPYAFDKVEVLRGPGSALYGSDAFGGVVQMLSPKLTLSRPLGTTATLAYGSGDSSVLTDLELSGGEGPVAMLAGLNYRQFGTIRTPTGDVPLSDNRHVSAHSKLHVELPGSFSVQAAYFFTQVADAGRTDLLYQGDYRRTDNNDHLAYARVVYTGESLLREAVANISFQRLDEHVDRYRCNANADSTVADLEGCIDASAARLGTVAALREKQMLDDRTNVFGGFAHARFALLDGDVEVVTGAEAYRESVDSRQQRARAADAFALTDAAGSFPDGARYDSYGLFAHGQATVWRITEQWRLAATAGARFSGARATADVADYGHVSSDFSGLVGTAGLSVADPSFLAFYANYSQGFRAPNLQETVSVGNTGSMFEIANPSLGPERIDMIEGGVKLQYAMVALDAAYYVGFLSDVITREAATYEGLSEVDGKPVARRVNGDSGLYQGVELAGRAQHRNVTLHGNLSWTRGDVELAGVEEPARRIPPLFYWVGVRLDSRSHAAYGELFVQGAARQDRLSTDDARDIRICESADAPGTLAQPCDGTPAWYTLNVRAGFSLASSWLLDLALLNVLDRRYRLHGSGFDAPGVQARASLTYRY